MSFNCADAKQCKFISTLLANKWSFLPCVFEATTCQKLLQYYGIQEGTTWEGEYRSKKKLSINKMSLHRQNIRWHSSEEKHITFCHSHWCYSLFFSLFSSPLCFLFPLSLWHIVPSILTTLLLCVYLLFTSWQTFISSFPSDASTVNVKSRVFHWVTI